jgi:hypothetical protein
MSPVSRFALVENGRNAPGLSLDGRRIEAPAPGRVLAAQFECGGLFLLLFTEDSPYEECLKAILLDGGGNVLDRVELANPYTPGMLTGLRVSGAESVDFGFFGDDQWRLTVLKEPKLRLVQSPSSPIQFRGKFGRHLLDLRRVK